MEQMIANGIQLIKTNASYVFDSDTVFYRNEIPFNAQSNEFDITECYYAQPIDFTDLSTLQFLSVKTSLTCVVKNYLGVTLATINAVNVGTYDTQNVFNVEIDWSTITGNLEYCYLQITDGTEYFKSEPLKMINLKQRIKIRYRMLRNHKSIGYFFNPDNEFYEFLHIFYIEAAVTEFKKEITKSVFEDSNQTLLNLFSSFRHSFLLKTFQVAYYMHEKVVTLSLCDEIYLSEIKAGNEYEGRIFLSKDETPQEEIIESTNLYISSTRYVVDKAFRLVGAAQETPIVPDPNLGIVPIHHTNPNGKKATFKTPYKLLPSKTLYTPQGSPTDYLFKIGGATDNFRNSHDVAWDSIASKTFAEFSALTVNADLHVQVRYIGSLTQTDVVATLYAPITDAPINPSTRTINPNPKTAASDLMIYPKLATGFNSVGISAGGATLFSQQRTFAELANSSDLTSFNTGVANLPITQEDGIGHLYLERINTSALTVNIATNQLDPTKEIIAYATPLTNLYYPTTPNGANPPAVNFDRINDTSQATDAAFVAFMNIFTMAVGERRTVVFRNNYKTTNNYQLEAFQIGRSATLGMFVGHGCSWGTTGNQYAVFEDSINTSFGVITTVFTIERPPSLINGNPHNYIKKYTNAKLETSLTGALANLSVNPMSNNDFGNNFANRPPWAMEFIAFFNGQLTLEEIRKVSLGSKAATFGLNPQYAWDYGQIVSTNQIPHVGSLTAPNLVLSNHTNTLGNLFI